MRKNRYIFAKFNVIYRQKTPLIVTTKYFDVYNYLQATLIDHMLYIQKLQELN